MSTRLTPRFAMSEKLAVPLSARDHQVGIDRITSDHQRRRHDAVLDDIVRDIE